MSTIEELERLREDVRQSLERFATMPARATPEREIRAQIEIVTDIERDLQKLKSHLIAQVG